MALPFQARGLLQETGGIGAFAGRFFTEAIRRRYEVAEFLKQCLLVGYKSLPLIGLTGFIMGLVLTMQLCPFMLAYGWLHNCLR